MDAKLPVKLQHNSQVAKTHKDERKSEKVKDRGDLKKPNISRSNREAVQPVKGFLSDRGDSERDTNGQRAHAKHTSNKKPEDVKKSPVDAKKIPANDIKITENSGKILEYPKKIPEDANKKTVEVRKSDVLQKYTKKDEGQVQNRLCLDSEGRKRLREKYTLKLKNNQNLSKNDDNIESKERAKIETRADPITSERKQSDDTKVKSVKSDKSSKGSCHTEHKQAKKPANDMCGQRKPIIKTYTLKNDNKVYKAVSFSQEKQQTPLQIKIPSDCGKHEREYSRESLQHLQRKKSVRTLIEDIPVELKHNLKTMKRLKRKKNRIFSPELSKGRASPPTEVARWVPSCVSHQTKPYYEAWVDTTLAAISKCTKTDKFLEKNFIQTFQRALQKRPETPDLIYENYNDERYTGIIKVRQR